MEMAVDFATLQQRWRLCLILWRGRCPSGCGVMAACFGCFEHAARNVKELTHPNSQRPCNKPSRAARVHHSTDAVALCVTQLLSVPTNKLKPTSRHQHQHY